MLCGISVFAGLLICSIGLVSLYRIIADQFCYKMGRGINKNVCLFCSPEERKKCQRANLLVDFISYLFFLIVEAAGIFCIWVATQL